MRVNIYCICGDSAVGSVTPAAKAKLLEDSFWQVHGGEGHGPTDAKTAAKARRKADVAGPRGDGTEANDVQR